jgi:lipopolysaccharide/colanic/teichoic acid biosynthesis glycosyltransferase
LIKRSLDIFCSSIGLLFLSPLFLAVAALVKIDSEGPVFFRQVRMGMNFRPFRIFKFRTMGMNSEGSAPLITVGGDERVTHIGSFLRKYKIDELPQLINVLLGDMSLVGPRPEVKKYVSLFRSDYEKLLTVRPGITDPASFHYSNEESILSLSSDWEEDYITRILPEKVRLSSEYVDNRCLMTDIKLIIKTVSKALKPGKFPNLRTEL